MKIKDLATCGYFNLGYEIPKPFHTILIYNKEDVQYEHSNGIAIGEHDGVNYLAYGKIIEPPLYWQYVS